MPDPILRDTFRPMFDELPGMDIFGMLSPKRKRALLELEAQRAAEINALDIGLGEQQTYNQFDQEQLAVMEQQFAMAKSMLQSTDPQMNALGASMVQQLSQAVRGQTQQNETEARATAEAARTAEIASMETAFERDQAWAQDIRRDVVDPYIEQLDSYNKVTNLIDSGERLGFEAAFTAFVQGIDNSVVRQGERLIYGGSNGLVTQAVDLFNKWAGGDASERSSQALKNSAAALINARLATVQSRLSTYEAEVTAFGGDTERVFSVVPSSIYQPVPIDRSFQPTEAPIGGDVPGTLEQVIGPQGKEMGEAPILNPAEEGYSGAIFDTLSTAADFWSRAWTSAAARESGASLHIDPSTGQLWEQTAEGQWREISTTPRQREDNLRRLRLEQPGVELTDEAKIRQRNLQERGIMDENGQLTEFGRRARIGPIQR